MKYIDSVCYKCEERYIGCHAECERYSEEAKQNEAFRQQWAIVKCSAEYTGDMIRRNVEQKLRKDKYSKGVKACK